ncbi:2-hydroxychromene-2-carboxylate isomerase [Streptomyces sp. NPDC059816]|uniref:2-hydroxychromene-2-carboxylate isomerase n=1 Tax=Streptomyces sp. NPDC059816 TaxID=3346960 RepID=UPI0036688D07
MSGAADGRARRGTKPPRFYFSLRSPYSWLAHHDLMRHHPDVAALVEWRPFWEPDERSRKLLTDAGGDFPYVAMSRAKHLYILQDVRRLVRERGLESTWPVDRDPRWEVPHLAYLAAVDAGRGPDFVQLAYRKRWIEGRDICDSATISAMAKELGVAEEPLVEAVDDPEMRRRGAAALLDVDRDGVFGVPFLVHGFDKFWGVDRLEAFAASVRGRTATAPTSQDVGPRGDEPPTTGQGGDQGHAGGCG